MSIPEIVTIGVVVGAAVIFLVRRAIGALSGQKGSCKSCGDSCGCALAELAAKSDRNKS